VFCFIHILVYAADVNILGGSIHSVRKNAEDSVVASKEIGLEVNAEKTEYMVMPQNQNAGQNHNSTPLQALQPTQALG
jgi:coproporphyrinogen III oxidase-like Fe-S oxidoreductase